MSWAAVMENVGFGEPLAGAGIVMEAIDLALAAVWSAVRLLAILSTVSVIVTVRVVVLSGVLSDRASDAVKPVTFSV